MRKVLASSIFIILCLCTTSCVSTLGTLPYGKWECSKMAFVINIDKETGPVYRGTLIKDNEKIETVVTFAVYGKYFTVYKATDWFNKEKK